MNEKTLEEQLNERKEHWKRKGYDNPTWGMLQDGYQSIPGIPDDFYSAEDPEVRIRFWNEQETEYKRTPSDYDWGMWD